MPQDQQQTITSSALLDEQRLFADLASDQEGGYGLDRRLVKAISKMGFIYPTLVQSKCIPLALEGKDVLVRAKTGSGKTAAFAIPMLQKTLKEKEMNPASGVRVLILVPTRELCDQAKEHIWQLMYYCRDVLSIQSLSGDNTKAQAAQLRDRPDIVISTPAKLIAHLNAQHLTLKDTLHTLIIDEADLVLSFGYSGDINSLVSFLPKICQSFLMSATLSPELEQLKRVMLNNPVVLKLEESHADGKLQQFYVAVKDTDKYLVMIALLKLGLLHGKIVFFVNDIESCYRLKLFLERFGVNSAVLNAELPHNSRVHILQQYNKGLFDFLIATDESIDADDSEEESDGDSDEEEEKEENLAAAADKKKKRRRGAIKKDKHYGVSRGVDFKGVNFVVNVDFPRSVKSYTHRVGRTARGGTTGTALSFVSQDDDNNWAMLEKVQESQAPLPAEISARGRLPTQEAEDGTSLVQPAPLALSMTEIEGFRYRVEDMKRSVTRSAVREARLNEIKQEVLNSERLKAHFEENPTELQLLRHDKQVGGRGDFGHLSNVPKYLVPDSLQASVPVPVSQKKKAKHSKTANKKRKTNDPLKSFEFSSSDLVDEDEDNRLTQKAVEHSSGDRIVASVGSLGESTSNRQKWKQRHKKGRFNPKTIAKQAYKRGKGWTH